MSNDEIIRLIGKIRERYDQVHEPSGKIVHIEVDLLKADIRDLYERISFLTLPHAEPVSQHSQLTEPEISEEEGPEMAESVSGSEFVSGPASEVFLEQQVAEASFPAEPLPEPDAAIAPAPVVPEPEPEVIAPVAIPEPVIEKETPPAASPQVAPQAPLQQVAVEPAPVVHHHETTIPVHSTLDLFGAPAVTLADKFRDEKRSISDKLHQETTADKSIGSKLRLKITDLRSAIGINDRFIFINELFEGDMRAYDDMLGRLNSCASLQEATEVFHHGKAMQGWSDELSSVERLLDFIHRRYA